MSILQRHLLTAAIGALGLVAGAAGAQPGPSGGGVSPPKPKIACAADMQRLCPNQTPGRGAVNKCVKAHMNDVSAQCRSSVQYARQMRKERKAAAGQSGAPAQTPPPAGGMASPH